MGLVYISDLLAVSLGLEAPLFLITELGPFEGDLEFLVFFLRVLT